MPDYRLASSSDATEIAKLHARSWQRHYKGIWPDDFLDNHVLDNRLAVWEERFSREDPSRRVFLVHEGEKLIGFCCTFLDRDLIHGALLDNIHVDRPWQGQGIGRQLIKDSATWVFDQRPDSGLFLWVLEGNQAAIAAYEKLGGLLGERKEDDIPTGGNSWLLRYSWPHIQDLT